MPRTFYSYRLGREVPLLSDEEYEPIATHLSNYIKGMKEYRKTQGCSLGVALNEYPKANPGLDLYEEVTGVRLDHSNDLYAVQLSAYGRPCPSCAKPFRTPQARMCAECGHQLPEGEVAGPLTAES